MLNLGRLEVLRAVVRHGSFSAAADALSYTQSAISQSIARLESETGVQLLVREHRGVTPTRAGVTLVGHAERIFAEVEAAQRAIAEVSGERLRRLRIASFPSGGAALLPLDLALLFEFPGAGPPRPGLRSVTLLTDPMQLLLAADHPLAQRPRLRLTDLRAEAWVQTSAASPCARHVVRCCREAGFEPEVTFESDDYDTVQGLVAAGVGVALVPRLALAAGIAGTVARSLSPASPVRHVTVATAANVPVAPAARSMIRELTELARRHEDRATTGA
jgi:DNA-binding transcriptional LysR family regulator